MPVSASIVVQYGFIAAILLIFLDVDVGRNVDHIRREWPAGWASWQINCRFDTLIEFDAHGAQSLVILFLKVFQVFRMMSRRSRLTQDSRLNQEHSGISLRHTAGQTLEQAQNFFDYS